MTTETPVSYTEEAVFASMDRAAFENGYVELITDDAKSVTIDLADTDADFESADIVRLEPIVARWQGEARAGQRPAQQDATPKPARAAKVTGGAKPLAVDEPRQDGCR